MKTTVKAKVTQKNTTKKGVKMSAPKPKKAPQYSNDKLVKLGLAETLKACEGMNGQQANKMATIIFYQPALLKKGSKFVEVSKPLTPQECKFLANSLIFFEQKSLSKVYKDVTKTRNAEINEALKGVLGRSKVPSFAEFVKVAKEGKSFFTIWDALGMFAKFNNSAKQLKKAERQNRATAKK